MGEIRENLRQNLIHHLSLNGMSQKELAEKLQISQSAVTNWIKGKNSPDIETVARICDILELSVVDLFGTNGPNPYSEEEKELIVQYRKKTDLQHAIRILLGLKK